MLNNSDEVSIELTSDLDVGSEPIVIGEGKTVNLKIDGILSSNIESIVVNNSNVTLSGSGTLVNTVKQANPILTVKGPNAVLTVDGPTVDALSDKGSVGNYATGIYLLDEGSVNFKSGVVKVGQGCCISSNNTTGGASVINISGGELYSDGAYAIYSPAQEEINITSGIVQGINARLGKITISGDAKIIPTTITAETCDDLGSNIGTSGCIWFGDTIALVVGTYNDSDGTDLDLTISDSVKVESNFRSAIAIYDIDTLVAQNVNVNVLVFADVKTTDAGFEAIKVYDHDAVAEAATAAGKTYEPIVDSDIKVNVYGSQVYPVQ